MKKRERKFNLVDYPEIKKVRFPKSMHIAYAVCTKDCGARQFIVDGSTQVCEYCGNQMFRTEVAEFLLKKT